MGPKKRFIIIAIVSNIVDRISALWCALGSGGATWPFFLENDEDRIETVNGEPYTRSITDNFGTKLRILIRKTFGFSKMVQNITHRVQR